MNNLTVGRRGLFKSLGLGAAASAFGFGSSRAEPTTKDKVRGIVFMVSDGMSPGVLTLAQAYSHLTRKRGTHWWELNHSSKASRGLMDTASANSMVTDSAAASTAWGSGQRVPNGRINLTADDKALDPIAAILKRKSNANIGLVTTATVTHATPAGFAAVVKKRDNEAEVAVQYLERADVILGGGSAFFSASKQPDKRNLRADFKKAGYDCVSSRDQFLAAKERRLLGTFTRGHLPFSIDRANDPELAALVPSLEEMAKAALERFLEDTKPFLLQIEGARVDHAAHLNDIGSLLADQLAFDDTLGTVLALTAKHPDVLVVVTSDHGNANPGLNGTGETYKDTNSCFARIANCKGSYEKILNEWKSSTEKSPNALAEIIEEYLGFALLKEEAISLEASLSQRDVLEWSHQLDTPQGLLGQMIGNHTGIGWTGGSHTSDPTIVTALGPQSERFSGMVRNTDVFGHFSETLA